MLAERIVGCARTLSSCVLFDSAKDMSTGKLMREYHLTGIQQTYAIGGNLHDTRIGKECSDFNSTTFVRSDMTDFGRGRDCIYLNRV